MRSQRDRSLAESLFVCEGKSCREIAGILSAGKETVQRWARDGKWMERRRRRRLDSPLASLERLKRERDRLIQTLGGEPAPKGDQPPQGEPPAKPDADDTLQTVNALQKLTQTIEKMESQQEEEIGPMLKTMGRFAEFVATRADANDRPVIHKWVEAFLNEERRKCI
jgi:transposase